ncbi:fungal-specific transcription factor domain-containing protein [Aspergillus alliaceus]|uniref:Fungal-specific transcription factor domain-containing protein n=1 Tax=Petromyces alliaceus TaxID=209559 RepID=A0A5N7CHF6_PETAA|nr:fungal-specific transcription factor domain-containing protein [Aspergillus alliaceus]
MGRVGSRQQPGSACDECRKRKLRCDRQRPQCGTCASVGIQCQVNDRRRPRRPRKGSDVLRKRICALEHLLSNPPAATLPVKAQEIDGMDELPVHRGSTATEDDPQPPLPQLPNDFKQNAQVDRSCQTEVFPAFLSGPFSPSAVTVLTDLMKRDLVQLYFDRVHPVVPILNQAKTCAWSLDPYSMSQYQLCLQHAMWTVSMAQSAQYDHIRDRLYSETRAMLNALDLEDSAMGVCQIEQVQAWLLLTFYEFSRTNYRRGWITAGRAFRLVQLLQLYDLDNPNTAKIGPGEDFVELEERRRTFWVAYCLDRFVSIGNGSPLTLNEEVICTRLPCREVGFQSGTPRPECFLSEAIACNEYLSLSPLAECTILVTIAGRALTHHRVSAVESVYGNMPQDFWARHEWLYSMISRRIKNLAIDYPSIPMIIDPMAMFTCMASQASVIYLCIIMESLAKDEASRARMVPYQERAFHAAQEIARLGREHERLGYFKTHFFMPLAISLGAKWLGLHTDFRIEHPERPLIEPTEVSLQALLGILRRMGEMNNLATYQLSVLKGLGIKI